MKRPQGTVLFLFLSLCYLGDMISAGSGVEEGIVAKIRHGWKKFREVFPVLISEVFLLRTKGNISKAYVRSVVLYGSEPWAAKQEILNKLERNDMMMVRWMCHVT